MKSQEVIRLVVFYDDGEHEPFESEQCGIFFRLLDVETYIDSRFNSGDLNQISAVRYSHDHPSWNIHIDGKESPLVLTVWYETLYGEG